VIPDTVLCRVVGLQFGLQTLHADVCLHRQSGPIRREALRQLHLAGPIAEAHRKHGSGAISELEYRQARELIAAWPE
jgi:hypothetical protein